MMPFISSSECGSAREKRANAWFTMKSYPTWPIRISLFDFSQLKTKKNLQSENEKKKDNLLAHEIGGKRCQKQSSQMRKSPVHQRGSEREGTQNYLNSALNH